MLLRTTWLRSPAWIALLLPLLGCAFEPDTELDADMGELEVVNPELATPKGPKTTPCDNGPCVKGVAGVSLINAAGERRRVEVNGRLSCDLGPGERCEVPLVASENAVIHVTGADGEATCDDPQLTLAQCVCAVLKIRC